MSYRLNVHPSCTKSRQQYIAEPAKYVLVVANWVH